MQYLASTSALEIVVGHKDVSVRKIVGPAGAERIRSQLADSLTRVERGAQLETCRNPHDHPDIFI